MPDLANLGYMIAAVAYAGLLVLLSVAWEGRGQGGRLIAAVLMTVIWALAFAYFSIDQSLPSAPALFFAETLYKAAWLVVLAGLVESGGFPRLMARLSYVAWIAVLLAGKAAMAVSGHAFVTVGLAGGLLLPVIGLVLLEQIYRNANTSGRWTLKFLYIGLGVLFVFDVFMYSQALLVGGISPQLWLARGYVVTVAVPLIALAARRNPDWSVRVFVSRDVVFYSTSFMAIGGYLMLMAAGGYLVRLTGGTWGRVAEVLFFGGALVLLAVLVGSTALRRKLKVFLVKNFYKHKYEYRDEWLRFIATLSQDHEGEDPRVTGIRAVARIVGSPGAVLLGCDETHAGRSIAVSWPGESLVPESACRLCANDQLLEFMVDRQWVIDLVEYRRDRDVYEQLELPEWLHSQGDWRLVVPVLLRERLLGILLLKEPPAGFELTFEDRDLLKTVARHLAVHLAQHESERRLAELRQFEAYNRLAAFLMHDLKNVVAQLDLLVANAERHRTNPTFVDDAIETVANAALRLTRLTEQLQRGEVTETSELCALEEVVRSAVDRSQDREPRPELLIVKGGLAVMAGRERLVDIIQHVIRNAQEATPRDGKIAVRLAGDLERAFVEVLDSGHGMTPEFIRERLFRPFDSTKGSKGMGIGAYEAREYARSLGGDVEVESSPGRGSSFRLILPAVALPAVA